MRRSCFSNLLCNLKELERDLCSALSRKNRLSTRQNCCRDACDCHSNHTSCECDECSHHEQCCDTDCDRRPRC